MPLWSPVVLQPRESARHRSSRGRVVGIHDGDTITLLDASKTQHKIRLAGIDAPELKQAFGTRSRQNLSNMAYDRDAVDQGVEKKGLTLLTEIHASGQPAARIYRAQPGLNQSR